MLGSVLSTPPHPHPAPSHPRSLSLYAEGEDRLIPMVVGLCGFTIISAHTFVNSAFQRSLLRAPSWNPS